MEKERVLRLTLTRTNKKKLGPYDVMASGEKRIEVRRPSPWIISRLFERDGPVGSDGKKTYLTPRVYDRIEFTNGYKATMPRFSWPFGGFHTHTGNTLFVCYSDGFTLQINDGDLVIQRG